MVTFLIKARLQVELARLFKVRDLLKIVKSINCKVELHVICSSKECFELIVWC